MRGKRYSTYSMATAQRLDVKEGKDLAGLVELERGDFTYSDGSILACVCLSQGHCV